MTDITTEQQVQELTWYTYKKVNGFDVYDSVVQAVDQPPNSSPWKPRILPDTTTYYNGRVWVIGKDVTTVDLTYLRNAAQVQADVDFTFTVKQLGANFHLAEQSSWAQQLTDAQAVLSGDSPSVLLTTLAEAHQIDITDLAKSIVAKSDAYNAAYAKLLADYQVLKGIISNATKIADLPAFRVPPIPRLV